MSSDPPDLDKVLRCVARQSLLYRMVQRSAQFSAVRRDPTRHTPQRPVRT